MACYYIRGSVYWIKYRDKAGKVQRESTAHRVSKSGKRAVEALCAQRTFEEKQTRGAAPHERWDAWVGDWLRRRYQHVPNTLLAYEWAWLMVRRFLRDNGVLLPRQLTRQHCFDLFDWRMTQDGGVRHNTALYCVQMLGRVMNEAVARGYATANPCRYLGIKKQPVREKPAFNLGHITIIRRHIAALPEGRMKEFYQNSFELARYHGCRISATQVNPQTQVNLQRGVIAFREKGGKLHVTSLHPAVRPLFEKLIAAGRTTTYERINRGVASRRWHVFLRDIGIKHVEPDACFHSWRVTVSTELAIANVSVTKAMRYVGHASTTVHRIYQRLNPEHLQEVVDAISDRPQLR